MTPERKAWWDSLPKEEKRVRYSVKWQQREIIAYNKAIMNEIICDSCYLKKQIREAKHAIKALRKQIAMRPAIKKEFVMFRFCPTCDCILNVSKARPFCDKCGQKLRW